MPKASPSKLTIQQRERNLDSDLHHAAREFARHRSVETAAALMAEAERHHAQTNRLILEAVMALPTDPAALRRNLRRKK